MFKSLVVLVALVMLDLAVRRWERGATPAQPTRILMNRFSERGEDVCTGFVRLGAGPWHRGEGATSCVLRGYPRTGRFLGYLAKSR